MEYVMLGLYRPLEEHVGRPDLTMGALYFAVFLGYM
jgi:hypothetical protein